MSRQIDEPSFGDLPEELAGLPATDPKVKAHFQKLAKDALQEQGSQYEARLADATRPVADPPKPTVKPTSADFWADPTGAVTRVAPTREEFNSMNVTLQRTAIQNARMLVSQQFNKDWGRFEKKVVALMSACEPAVAADPENWVTAYYAIKGREADALVDDAVRTTTARMSSEKEAPADPPPPPTQPLNSDQKTIISKLGISEENYRRHQGGVLQWPARQ